MHGTLTPRTPLRSLFRTGLLLLLAALALSLLAGCGKRGWPQPKNKDGAFKWQRAMAQPEGGCLRIDAALEGNLRNVDYIALELQTAGDADDCPTCPFAPNERAEFAPEQLGISATNGAFRLLHCPARPSSAYRWRLIGVNVRTGLEHAVSSVRGVDMAE